MIVRAVRSAGLWQDVIKTFKQNPRDLLGQEEEEQKVTLDDAGTQHITLK